VCLHDALPIFACVKPAASVRSEPGSNSQVENLIYGYYQSHHCVKHRTQTSGHAQIDENIFTHQTIIADHPGNIVLIKKRVRQSSLRQSDLSNHPQTMPPTFLFLLYKIVKEQTASKPSKTSPAQQTRDHHSTRRSNPHQRLVCGAGLLDQSNQPVNHFFLEENHKLNRSSFLPTSTELPPRQRRQPTQIKHHCPTL